LARLLLAPLPCRRNPGRTAFVSRTTQPFGLNRRMTTRISGRAGQKNPHRGGEIRSENRFASKHVLAALKSRTTAEARIWVREIIVVVLSFNFCELHPGDVRVVPSSSELREDRAGPADEPVAHLSNESARQAPASPECAPLNCQWKRWRPASSAATPTFAARARSD